MLRASARVWHSQQANAFLARLKNFSLLHSFGEQMSLSLSFLTNLMVGQEIQNLISKQKIEMHLYLALTPSTHAHRYQL